MKKVRLTCAAWGICALLSSCGTSLTLQGSKQFMKVKPGMTQEEVTSILGTPTHHRFTDNIEQWEYEKTHALSGQTNIIIVDFADGKVTGLNTFDNTMPPRPEVIVTEPTVCPETIVQPGPIQPEVMSDNAYNELCEMIRKKSFRDEKMELLTVGTQERYFTSRQCSGLLSLLTWDDDRMTILNKLADRIVDPENGEVIINTFDSLFKQEDAARKLGFSKR